MNVHYGGPHDLPAIIPVFPLAGALLLPRGQMPLNIFEPRYVAMVDHALAGARLVGMIQPQDAEGEGAPPRLYGTGCAGRITQLAETGDGRYLLSLTGVARFRVAEEVEAGTPFRQCRADWTTFASDLRPRAGENAVDREAVLAALRTFTEATGTAMDWDGVEKTPNEALVNALSMLAPFGVREKQALLEAADLKSRAEILVALTEIELAKSRSNPQTTLQ